MSSLGEEEVGETVESGSATDMSRSLFIIKKVVNEGRSYKGLGFVVSWVRSYGQEGRKVESCCR